MQALKPDKSESELYDVFASPYVELEAPFTIW
jgi:hypothetical protein